MQSLTVSYDEAMLAVLNDAPLTLIYGHLIMLGLTSFLWLPLVYAAYIMGRRQFSSLSFYLFLTTEACCIALACLYTR